MKKNCFSCDISNSACIWEFIALWIHSFHGSTVLVIPYYLEPSSESLISVLTIEVDNI